MKYFAKIIAVTLALLFGSQTGFGDPVESAEQARYRWKSGKIRIAISRSVLLAASINSPDSSAYEAVRRGIDAWQGIADVELVTEISDRENANISGAGGDGISLITIAPTAENILLFGKDDLDAAAKTRVFYNRRDHITEADIVLNPYQQFSTDGRFGTYDLENVITHEIGHLLGLRHNGVFGSIMYRTAPKNGIFGLADISNRKISATDRSELREIYGAQVGDVCCGQITGRLIGAAKSARTFEVWVESVSSGRVVGQAAVKRDGSFRVGGLDAGEFRVFTRAYDLNGNAGVFEVGNVTVAKGEAQELNKKIGKLGKGVSFSLLGINGLLGDSNLKLTRGQSYTIYVGGSGFDADSLKLRTNSDVVTIESGSIRELDYVDGVSAVSFRVVVDPEAPEGNYSIFGVASNGSTDAIIGGLTVSTDR